MKYEKNRKFAGIDEYQLFNFFKILALPLIALILIIIIVVVDRIPKKKNTASSQAPTDITTNALESTYNYDFSNHGLNPNTLPAIDTLISQYQTAKLKGDAETIFRLYGRYDNEGIEVLQARMNEEKKFYEDFLDTELYTAHGVDENSYIVLIKTNVKFKKINTPAPTLIWTYITRDEDENYIMKDASALTEEENARKRELFESEDVILLSNEVNTKLTQAVINDVKLSNLYQLLNEGGLPVQEESSPENPENATEESYEDMDIAPAGRETRAVEDETQAQTESPETAAENTETPAESANEISVEPNSESAQ